MQEVVHDLTQAYTKAMMLFREKLTDQAYNPEDGKGFIEIFTFPDIVWDMLSKVEMATSWDDMPEHPAGHRCKLCLITKKGV